MKPKFIIEHLEPKVFPWCVIEYEHISETVGKDNLIFTNIFSGEKKLDKFGKVLKNSVKDIDLGNVCVLDPDAKETLTTKDAGKFDAFVFGGILGDYPPKKRTKDELTKFLPKAKKFNIGKEQMSTDTAVFVVHQILKGKRMNDFVFKDGISIPMDEFSSIDLPYRYVLVHGRVWMSDKLIDYLKKKKGF
jgi:ribosome biogenesis SPOUT family RNA methylase Rps3